MVGQAPTFQQELTDDISQLEKKFVGLAEAVPVKEYGWRPAEGVRSISEIYNHIAAANYFIASFAGVPMPEDMAMKLKDAKKPAEIFAVLKSYEVGTDRAEIVERLRASFSHAVEAVNSQTSQSLLEVVPMFGSERTKRGVLNFLVMHAHEHLGQSIAYARMVGVTPPWTAAQNAGGEE